MAVAARDVALVTSASSGIGFELARLCAQSGIDTEVGQSEGKADPADVARTGFEAALKGEVRVIHGLTNTVLVAASNFVPPTLAAGAQRKITEPGSGER